VLIDGHPDWDKYIYTVMWTVPAILVLFFALIYASGWVLVFLLTTSTVNLMFNASIAWATLKLQKNNDILDQMKAFIGTIMDVKEATNDPDVVRRRIAEEVITSMREYKEEIVEMFSEPSPTNHNSITLDPDSILQRMEQKA